MNAPTSTPAARSATQPEQSLGKPLTGWRLRLYTIIFEADTVAGRRFDQALLVMIVLSVIMVIIDSVPMAVARNNLAGAIALRSGKRNAGA